MSKQTYILASLIFLLSTGGYLAMPLFPLLTEIHQISLTQASSLTAIYIFAQKVTPVILGPVGDYYGYKRMAVLGEMIRGIGFIGVGCSSDYYVLFLSALLAGLGGGFAVPALQSLIMKSSTKEDWPKVSSLRVSASNAGLLLGPTLAGIVIWTGKYNFIFIIAGILYVIGGLLLMIFIEAAKKEGKKKQVSLEDFLEVIHNKSFVKLIMFMFMFYILVAQLFVTIPDYAKQFTNQIQLLFLINGILGLTLQYPIGLLISKYRTSNFMYLGSSLVFLSFLTLTFSNSFIMLIIAIILFTIGEICILPIVETQVANASDKSGNMGLYFGVSHLSDGVGRPLGSILGGWLLVTLNPSQVWFIFMLLTVLLFLYYITYMRTRKRRFEV